MFGGVVLCGALTHKRFQMVVKGNFNSFPVFKLKS